MHTNKLLRTWHKLAWKVLEQLIHYSVFSNNGLRSGGPFGSCSKPFDALEISLRCFAYFFHAPSLPLHMTCTSSHVNPGFFCPFFSVGTNFQWHPLLTMLKDRIEDFTKHSFNSLLCNLYRNEKDSVDWHSDDEPELGRNPVIASLSLGATRMFEMRKKPLPVSVLASLRCRELCKPVERPLRS